MKPDFVAPWLKVATMPCIGDIQSQHVNVVAPNRRTWIATIFLLTYRMVNAMRLV